MEEKDEELYKILNKIGISLYKEEKYEEALINFEEAIKINDSEDVLYFNKASCENKLNLYNEAIKDYNKGLEIYLNYIIYIKSKEILKKLSKPWIKF